MFLASKTHSDCNLISIETQLLPLEKRMGRKGRFGFCNDSSYRREDLHCNVRSVFQRGFWIRHPL